MARAKSVKKPAPPTAKEAPAEVTPPAKDLSHLPTWNCRVEGGPKNQQWTVGETFHLKCDGPSAKFLSTDLQFKLPEKAQYQLRILETEKQSDNSLYLLVTSYNAGNHNLSDLYIMDQGEEVVKVEPLILQVKSVLEKPDQKPFGPIMAMKLTYPQWIWVVLLGVLVVTFLFSVFRLRRRIQMKRVIEELKQHNTALGAFNQFNKDFRQLGRHYIFGSEEWSAEKKEKYIAGLDEVFRMYLLREFFVPALDWKSKLVLKTISHQDKKRFGVYGDELQKFINELDRAKSDTDKLRVHDCKQLTQMAKRVTQNIWKVRKT